jgi:hypothetical protein
MGTADEASRPSWTDWPGDVTAIHIDDLAWHHSSFNWGQLLIDHILTPLRRNGPPISYRPDAWVVRDRPGAIRILTGARLVIVQGVGVCSRELEPRFDGTVWVHARAEVARRRVFAKGADDEQFINDWMSQENSFLTANQPWLRADLLVGGDLGQPNDPGRRLRQRRHVARVDRHGTNWRSPARSP